MAGFGTDRHVVTHRSAKALFIFGTPPPPPSISNKTHAPGLGCSLTPAFPGFCCFTPHTPYSPAWLHGWKSCAHSAHTFIISPSISTPESSTAPRLPYHPYPQRYGLCRGCVWFCICITLCPRKGSPQWAVSRSTCLIVVKGDISSHPSSCRGSASTAGQQGLCSWDCWCWWWSSSALWITVTASNSPEEGGRDTVSHHICIISCVFFLAGGLSIFFVWFLIQDKCALLEWLAEQCFWLTKNKCTCSITSARII